jgi:hypothetical protein
MLNLLMHRVTRRLNSCFCANTCNLCSPLNARGKFSQHSEITGKTIVLNVNMFTVLGSKWGEKSSDLRLNRVYFGKNFLLCIVMHVCLITTASCRFVSPVSEH